MDLYHLAAMLSLRRIKALFLHGKPRTEFASGQGLPCKNKAFYSPEILHGCQVKKVYVVLFLPKSTLFQTETKSGAKMHVITTKAVLLN